MSANQTQQSQPAAPQYPIHYPKAQGLYDPQLERDACGMGFVVDMKGRRSHAIVTQALEILENLTHRGAAGSEVNTGDGAGIMLQIPHSFLASATNALGFDLPPAGSYGVGMVFLPQDETERAACEAAFDTIANERGFDVLGWRTVPTNNRDLGSAALRAEPVVRQVFVAPAGSTPADDLTFERQLYIIRKQAEQRITYGNSVPGGRQFYMPSFSSRTLIYKGMLLAEQLPGYYLDLADPTLETAMALVHSRFSTNTFPSWERAHPYRYVIHNGEINTLRGNVNWLRAREAQFKTETFGDDLAQVLPVIDPSLSDTGMFDNCLEFLTLTGRSLPHAVMMMIPEPWNRHEEMDLAKRAFYEYHACLMEPWDGPASIGFTDGTRVGAVLDRNGLRPSRYYVTKDDLVIMASEVGVLDVPAEQVAYKGRLQPGRMFLVDTEQGRIISDEELKAEFAAAQPYQKWLEQHLLQLDELAEPHQELPVAAQPVLQRQQAFGYTFEELRMLIAPMAQDGKEALGSMGDDTPPAVLSDKSQPLYNYFKQLFAQVTNPPIDAIREELITGTETMLGSTGNILEPTAYSARRIKVNRPILTNEELHKLRHVHQKGFKTATLDMLYPVAAGATGLETALERLCHAADEAIEAGANLLIISDRDIDSDLAAMPALLATSCLHHHLIRTGQRTQVSLLLESGEPREVHHFATLLGYGADTITPYLAFDTIENLIGNQLVTGVSYDDGVARFVKASLKGVIKILSKMGISTIQSYRGAQIFEALGLNQAVVDRYFAGTASRIEGVGMDVLADEVAQRHRRAFPVKPAGLASISAQTLDAGGRYQYRENGEQHLYNPSTIHSLQHAVRNGEFGAFQKYSTAVNDRTKHLCTLRGLLEFRTDRTAVPLDEVESVESIMHRFKSGAMSYGSISAEAHETLAIAMNRIGGKSNSGEGGEDPTRFEPLPNGDSKNSAIKQVASGRFGVTSQYLVNAEELQIKMAQGAKPGEGGHLPGHKVYPWIARVRHSTPGVGLISPPPHHDIYSIEDLAQLIFDLKNANPRARINVKLVSEVGVGTIAAGVAKGHADVILISGSDGGTGASPQTSIKHAGLPWELGVAETHQTLLLNDLRSRVTIETDGQMKTGRDVVVAALLGAEEFGFATSPLIAMGCIMMRVCHLNTCPVGIATQDPALRRHFMGKPEHVVNFMRFIAMEVREIMAQLGFRSFDEMVGRTDALEMVNAIEHWKARGLDLSKILYQPEVEETTGRFKQIEQEHGLDQTLDATTLLDLCRPALVAGEPVQATLPIRNINRTTATILGSEITRRYGADGLPEDTIELTFNGSAGQSFGAFTPRGLTLRLEGDANDYIGKGLSGAKLIVLPPAGSTFDAATNIIVGNVALYGATSGEAYFSGIAGERFAVRNSGAEAVVEGVGDHGCEYMTGGRVAVLGETGRNFAAGMSGGVAYVYDEHGTFPQRCNTEMVSMHRVTDAHEIKSLRDMIWRHAGYTSSRRAWQLLSNWQDSVAKFYKVVPNDYQRMLTAIEQAQQAGLKGDDAVMAAFTANTKRK